MAGLFKNLFGNSQPSTAADADDGFADFVKAPGDIPISLAVPSSTPIASAHDIAPSTVLYTRWYRVWERTSPGDFAQEAMIAPFLLLIIFFHIWGTRKNRRKAKDWAEAHVHALRDEFAVVGFDGVRRRATSTTSELASVDPILREKSAQEFISYATGRQNVAFVDIMIQMPKRYSPVVYLMELAFSFLIDTFTGPVERMEATAYTFDGKEKDLVPVPGGDASSLKTSKSAYDGFIWAIIHKNCMRSFRQDRYDASMTFTKDSSKLPSWLTVMTESAEISDILLTPELAKAVEQAGDHFEYLIVSDQPLEKPKKLEETNPRKRVQISLKLPSSASGYAATKDVFTQFLRFPDKLVTSAHFRPEVTRKLRNTREQEIKKLRRVDDDEKAEDRRLAAEKLKKEERERLLRGMSADEQRKFLEREREKEQRRSSKRQSRRV